MIWHVLVIDQMERDCYTRHPLGDVARMHPSLIRAVTGYLYVVKNTANPMLCMLEGPLIFMHDENRTSAHNRSLCQPFGFLTGPFFVVMGLWVSRTTFAHPFRFETLSTYAEPGIRASRHCCPQKPERSLGLQSHLPFKRSSAYLLHIVSALGQHSRPSSNGYLSCYMLRLVDNPVQCKYRSLGNDMYSMPTV